MNREPYSNLNIKYGINIENKNEIRIKDCYENILIFTDGSKNQNGHTGYGKPFTFSEEKINEVAEQLPSHNSIFQSEAIAISKACEIINNKNLSNL